MADGSLKFDVKINTDGFKEGVSSIGRAAESCAKSAGQAGQKINDAFRESNQISTLENQIGLTEEKIHILTAEMEKMGNAKVPTDDYKILADLVGKAQTRLDVLLDRQAKLETMGASKNSSRWKNLQYDIDETTKKLQVYKRELQGTVDQGQAFTSGKDSTAYQKKALTLESLNQKLDLQKQKLSGLIAKENEAGVKTANTASQLKRYQKAASGAGIGSGKLSSYMGMAASYGNKLLAVALKLGGAGLGKLKALAGQAASSMMKLGKAFLFGRKQGSSLNRGMAGMLKQMLLFSMVNKIISGISSAFKEGIQNYARYSKSFNATMSSFVSSLLQFKNSIASAFSPILNAVIPILDTLIQKLIQVINVVGQFFAALTGKNSFSKAVKVNKDYAKSIKGAGSAAKGAGKDAKKALAPFDELNQIQESSNDSSSGGAGVIDPSQMFEEVPIESNIKDFAERIKTAIKAGDWSGVGKIIGDEINNGVTALTEKIDWDNCGNQISSFVNKFTSMFNNLIATIDWNAAGMMFGTGINTMAQTIYLLLTGIDWNMLGMAIAQGLNGLVYKIDWDTFGRMIGAFFQAKISGLAGFVSTVDWATIGIGIAAALMGVMAEIDWAMVGSAFAGGLSGLISIAGNFASTFDWTAFGSNLALSLSTFFQTFDWAGTGTAISDIVIGLLDALIAFIMETDWMAFGEGIGEVLVNIDWLTIVNRIYGALGAALGAIFGSLAGLIGELIASGVDGAFEYFKQSIDDCGGNVALGILNGIIGIFSGIVSWIYNHMFKPFLDGFLKAFGISGGTSELEKYGKNLWDGFCKGIKKFFANPIAFIKENITTPFLNGIKNLLGIRSPSTALEEVGDYTVGGFNLGVAKNQNSTKSIVQSWASGIASWFSNKLGLSNNNSEESKKWATGIMSGYNNTIDQGYAASQSVMERWADSICKWFTGREGNGINEATWMKFADTIIKAFTAQLLAGHTATKAPLEVWSANVRTWFWGDANPSGTGGLYKFFYDMGKRINEGFANGVSDFSGLTRNAVNKWAKGAVDEARKELDIHSPSRKSYSIAEYLIKGFNNGISDMAKTSRNVVQGWLDGVMDIMNGTKLQMPMEINIPNASSYLPRIAAGTVTPPRAGEYQELKNSVKENSLLEELTGLIRQLRPSGQNVTSGDENINLNLFLEGDKIYESIVKRNRKIAGSAGKNLLLE